MPKTDANKWAAIVTHSQDLKPGSITRLSHLSEWPSRAEARIAIQKWKEVHVFSKLSFKFWIGRVYQGN